MLNLDDENIKRTYKYYPVETEEQFSHIKNLILDGELYFSNPSKINDPYDSFLDFSFSHIKEKDITGFIKNTAPENGKLMSSSEEDFLETLIDKLKSILFQIIQDQSSTNILRSGILICALTNHLSSLIVLLSD